MIRHVHPASGSSPVCCKSEKGGGGFSVANCRVWWQSCGCKCQAQNWSFQFRLLLGGSSPRQTCPGIGYLPSHVSIRLLISPPPDSPAHGLAARREIGIGCVLCVVAGVELVAELIEH
ncbi:unnamed protein product [Urochloa humidicola]